MFVIIGHFIKIECELYGKSAKLPIIVNFSWI